MAGKANTRGKTGQAKAKPASTKAKKSAPKKGRTPSKVSPPPRRFGDSLVDEIILILLILASVLALLSLLSSHMGAAGALCSNILKGLFGFGGLLLPVLVIVISMWLLMSEEKKYLTIRLLAALIGLLAFSAIIHVLNLKSTSPQNFVELYQNGATGNGGAFGGILGNTLVKAFDKIGAYLILVVILLISFILGTGKSFFNAIGELIYLSKENRRYRAERRAYVDDEDDEYDYMPEPRPVNTRKKKRKDFNIQIVPEDQYQEEPVVQATVFKDKPKKKTTSKGAIYDFAKAQSMRDEQDKSALSDINLDAIKEKTMVPEPEYLPEIHSSGAFEEDLSLEQQVVQEDFVPEINMPEENILDNDIIEEPEIIQKEMPESHFKEAEPLGELPVEEIQSQVENTKEALPEKDETKSNAGPLETNQDQSLPGQQEPPEYHFPPLDLLGKSTATASPDSKMKMLENAKKLEETLKSFGVEAKVIQINKGPTVTRYELSPRQGVKVSKIVGLADDIALNLAAAGIRIEAPIPGKAAVGIEVPNKETLSVYLRSVLESEAFQKFPSKLAFAIGEDIGGNPIVTDIGKMPHLLIAGATGSGKSVCINTLITSILYKAKPDEVKLLLVDPKVVELSVYNGIPHLLIPVVTDPKKAAGALNWAVREMLERYNAFAENNVRDISGYNAMKTEKGEIDLMPKIVIIIDELADLMMAAPGEVEDSICRLAQMARAAGLHLIIATQRPSVDVITGVIKANIPSRMAFAVSSGVDSRTILDMVGAEKLLGKGDMLFSPMGTNKPQRIQGAFVTDKEVENIVAFVKSDQVHKYDQEMIEKITASSKNTETGEDSDEFLDQAIQLVVEKEKASVSMLQRQFRIGYNRAARLMDDLEHRGIVGPEDGSKPRRVLMTQAELLEYKNNTPAE